MINHSDFEIDVDRNFSYKLNEYMDDLTSLYYVMLNLAGVKMLDIITDLSILHVSNEYIIFLTKMLIVFSFYYTFRTILVRK